MAAGVALAILLTTVTIVSADEIHGYFVDIEQGPSHMQIY